MDNGTSYINDWAVNTMATAIQQNHDDCIMNPDSCHSTLSQMYSDSQSASDRKALKEEADAEKEDADSMTKKLKGKNKKKAKNPLSDLDWRYVAAAAAAFYFMRR